MGEDNQKRPEGYADLHRLKEDTRIGVIGDTVMKARKTVVVFVDEKPPEKVVRYRKRLTERYPGIQLGATIPGTPGAVCFRASPPPLTSPGVN